MTKTNISVHFSSKTDLWATPHNFFDELDKEFDFLLDVAAIKENAKCKFFYSPQDDGLSRDWQEDVESYAFTSKNYKKTAIWCNPPYGRELKNWVKKAYEESSKGDSQIVMLIPARTDTIYFHDFIYKKESVEIRFIKGRLKFGDAKNSAPFPSMLVVFNPI